MGTPSKNYTVASRASGEKGKKASTSNVGVGSTPPTNLNATRSKANSRSNTSHRPGEGHVKTHNQKLNFIKTQAKAISWRETLTQGGGDRMKAL
jgi:hypothetical protein